MKLFAIIACASLLSFASAEIGEPPAILCIGLARQELAVQKFLETIAGLPRVRDGGWLCLGRFFIMLRQLLWRSKDSTKQGIFLGDRGKERESLQAIAKCNSTKALHSEKWGAPPLAPQQAFSTEFILCWDLEIHGLCASLAS